MDIEGTKNSKYREEDLIKKIDNGQLSLTYVNLLTLLKYDKPKAFTRLLSKFSVREKQRYIARCDFELFCLASSKGLQEAVDTLLVHVHPNMKSKMIKTPKIRAAEAEKSLRREIFDYSLRKPELEIRKRFNSPSQQKIVTEVLAKIKESEKLYKQRVEISQLVFDNKLDELKAEINTLPNNDQTEKTIFHLIYLAAESGKKTIVEFLLAKLDLSTLDLSKLNTCCEELSEARDSAEDEGHADIVHLLQGILSKLFEKIPRRKFGKGECEDMMRDAHRRQDADCAIDVAKSALENSGSMGIYYIYYPLYWLLKAREYNQHHKFFEDDNPVAKLLQDTKIVHLNGLEFKSTWFIEKFVNCPSVLELRFHFNSSWDFITEQFSNYLAATTSLKKLKMWTMPGALDCVRMDSAQVKYIADGLRINTSIEQIDLHGNNIDDNGVKYIIDALEANKNNMVYTINFASNGRITDIGARLILDYVSRDDSSLVYVNLYESNISSDLLDKINNALQEKRSSTKKPAIRQTPLKP